MTEPVRRIVDGRRADTVQRLLAAALRHRVGDAVGPLSPTARETFTMALVGALVLAGTGYLAFEDLPRRLGKATDLLLAGRRNQPKP